MRKAGLGTLFVSFDGLRAESYRRLRGKGMAQVKQALEQLAEPSLRARLPRISVRCAKLTESPGEVRALLEWTADLGIVSEVQFQTFWPWPRRKPLEGIERELGTEKLCCQVFGAMNVLTDGTVSPCGFDAKGELAIGNALSSRLDDSIVNGLAALRFRRTHLRGARSEIPVCGDCLLPRWSGGAQTLNVGQYLQMTDVQRDEFARSVAAL